MNFNTPYYMYPSMPNMTPGMQLGIPNMMPGMQPGITQPIGYPFYPTTPGGSSDMPYMNTPEYQGSPGMYLPPQNPYGAPMGVPLYPLYGYDNSTDLDKDAEYMKYLYPHSARLIQREIDNECDQMEYDGSVMFDEYPDKVYLERIVDRIYEKVKDVDEEPQVETQSLYFYPTDRRSNHLNDLITILFLNEMFNRRRRYRGRRRWF